MTSVAYGAPPALEGGYTLSPGLNDGFSPQLAYSMPSALGSFQQMQPQSSAPRVGLPVQISPTSQSFPSGQVLGGGEPQLMQSSMGK